MLAGPVGVARLLLSWWRSLETKLPCPEQMKFVSCETPITVFYTSTPINTV